MVKIAICDDDTLEIEKTESLVRDWAIKNHINVEIFRFADGDGLLDNHKSNPADILLLDIMMPLFNGMETAKEIRKMDSTTIIIFLTSSPEFAIESYDVKASGYLLKPVNSEKLYSLLDECMESIKEEPENIIIRSLFGYQKIYVERIECIEAQNRKTVITLNDGSEVESLETFSKTIESIIENSGFFQCHRSYIVSFENVDRFNSTEIITKCGKHVPIARGYGRAFKDAYFAHMFKRGK